MNPFKEYFIKGQQNKDEGHLFSDSWLQEWRKSINKSESYSKQAAAWNIPLILLFKPLPDFFKSKNSVGIYLDLRSGTCTELRYAVSDDIETNCVVLSASEKSWLQLLQSGKNPTLFLLNGKLKLEKGSKTLLVSNAGAAKALLDAAPSNSGDQIPNVSEQESNIGNNRPTSEPHERFSTVTKGLDFESFPMKLFQKAKIYGVWNPSDISFEKDRSDWKNMSADEQTIIMHLSSLFLAGEEAVTLDLLPLIRVIAKEGRIEEEIYITSFLWEEAKHTEFFARFVMEVIKTQPDADRFHGPFYKKLFYEKLPQALSALDHDRSPAVQLRASATYNMIVEGTLAETGYEAYYKMLDDHDLMPGLREGVLKLKQDESRHIAYGLWLINRILEENEDLHPSFENLLDELLTDATNIIHEIFDRYDTVPFGLEEEWFLDYAIKQFQHRMEKLKLNN
ncbi:R2-like ligand-binding oxidase [Rhodohalobacter mucosus]|uniref:R2-like ligand binding oxidase n=1 Tax=Rhodohalobacter mucosus TaxID=2079485 RepID=A0A316TNH3_9BACT|nr:R2-like ligand-binding oxidase [Rhodohalobacter mucosus]PWN05960.1 R2-like ligand-binding oxidase [Rhodohalobacter mucosus]